MLNRDTSLLEVNLLLEKLLSLQISQRFLVKRFRSHVRARNNSSLRQRMCTGYLDILSQQVVDISHLFGVQILESERLWLLTGLLGLVLKSLLFSVS